MVPKQNMQNETRIDVEVMVKERPMKTADLQLEWSLAKGESGKPTLVTPLPGKPWVSTIMHPGLAHVWNCTEQDVLSCQTALLFNRVFPQT